jgi:general secretion pathway protein C
MSLFSNSARFLRSWSTKNRPPFEAAYIYILALFIGYLIADLGTLWVRPNMLPTQPPPNRPVKMAQTNFINPSQYSKIPGRNIFNQDGKIPAPLTAGQGGPSGPEGIPVASQLPLKLEGTMVHANPHKSVCTITVKGKPEATSFMVDREIEGMARITAIERRKVVFRNLSNNRLEFIEIPKDGAISFGVKDATPTTSEVQQNGNFEYTMRRADVTKYLGNLGQILQQARMIPNIVPGSGGRVDGFKFVNIEPGSIFEKLGFKPGDTLKKVNGEEVNTPTKGMELFNSLKSESRLQISVERNGREETFKYDIPD